MGKPEAVGGAKGCRCQVILRSAFETCGVCLAVLVTVASCGDARSGARANNVTPAGGSGGSGGSGTLEPPATGNQAGVSGAPVVVEEPPYPRTWADEALTQRLIEGEVSLVGSGFTACTNELPAPGDRWCAFSRAGQAGATELWVANVSQALREGPVSCDGTREACLQLTSNLWTGFQVWGPGHPYSHRFDGDTLIFHADAANDVREPYEGPVFAWRPGWSAARRISSERGVVCNGHRRSAVAYCIDALDVDVEPDGLFSAPVWHSFDLLAGKLDSNTEGPLPLVERIASPTGDSQAFRAQFTRQGDKLAYSSVLEGDAQQTLRWVSLTGVGPFETKTVLGDAAEWELAHDGAAVYVLRGFSPDNPLGNLALADFPSGANVQPIASDVDHIDLVGVDDPLTEEDHGLGYVRWTSSGEAFDFIKDRTKVDEVQKLASSTQGHELAPDGAHTIFFQALRPDDYPAAQVARNDGSGACTLNRELGAETYGGRFSEDGSRVFWIEYGSSGSEEGWLADPETCQQKVQFGDWVLGYLLTSEFVVFEGGDEADSTSFLQYARWSASAATDTLTPLVVAEHPQRLLTLHEGAATYLVYTRGGDSPESQGLFVHGPLETGFPAP